MLGIAERKDLIRQIALWCGLVVFAGLYFFFATLFIHQTNQDRQRSDQQNNIRLAREAKELRETGGLLEQFPHHTDGVVNPLWPWLSSFFLGEEETDRDFFTEGKWINTTIACVGLIVIALFLSRRMSLFGVFLFLGLAGFGAFLKRGTYFQPEPVYYLLLLTSWLCVFSIFDRPRLSTFTLLGFLTGLAYLAKSSIQLLLLAFIGVYALQLLYRLLKDGRDSRRSHLISAAAGIAVMIAAFLLTASPRLITSNDRYGSPFHSWPSLWMWEHTFDEGAALMATYPDPRSIPEDERPSLANYAKESTLEKAGERFEFGLDWTLSNFFTPTRTKVRPKDQKPWKRVLPDRGNYLLFLTLAAATLGVGYFILRWLQKGDPQEDGLCSAWPSKLLFTVGVFAAYTLAFSWYAVVGKGDRFLLALYPPIALTLVWSIDALACYFRDHSRYRAVFHVYASFAVVMLLLIGARLLQIANFPQFYTK